MKAQGRMFSYLLESERVLCESKAYRDSMHLFDKFGTYISCLISFYEKQSFIVYVVHPTFICCVFIL